MILPKRNKQDVEDIPDDIRKSMSIIYAEKVNDVLNNALEKPTRPKKSTSEGNKNGKNPRGR